MDKAPDAFRTISEVAEWLDTPAHVLRFWESRFPQVRPVKRAGGRRYYRPADVALLSGIKKLLHDDGLTIRGVQKMLREQGIRYVAGLADGSEPTEGEREAEENIFALPEETPQDEAPAPEQPVEPEPLAARAQSPSEDSAPVRRPGFLPSRPPAAETPDLFAEPVPAVATEPSSDRSAVIEGLRRLDPATAGAVAPRLKSIYERLVALRERMAADGDFDREDERD